jgi:hypothetical protein
MDETFMNDLVLLVADGNMKAAVEGILKRRESLGIHDVLVDDIVVHDHHDAGCFKDAHNILRPFCKRCRYALVVMDHEGTGAETLSRSDVEAQVEQRLAENGWSGRNRAIVIQPELENWFWSDSPHVATVTGWPDLDSLRGWLVDRDFCQASMPKPVRPKEALQEAVKHTRTPRSASLYSELARRVSLERCSDPAFLRFKETLQEWFGLQSHAGDALDD